MKFTYTATKDGDGTSKQVSGVIQAVSKPKAITLLEEQGLIVSHIKRKKIGLHEINLHVLGPSRTDIVLFTKNLSVMIRSGLTLVESLQISIEQAHGSLTAVLRKVLRHVQNGESFARALETQQRHFPRLYQDMVRVGEVSGTLDINLDYLAHQLAKDRDMRRKITGALLYPLIILLGVGGLGLLLAVVVLPRLTNLFRTLNADLPASTELLIWISEYLEQYGLWTIVGIFALILFFILGYRLAPIKYIVHYIVLRIPLFGRLVHQVQNARFTRTLGALLHSGVPISESLDAVEEAMGNMVYERAVRRIRINANTGESLASSMEKYTFLFPRIVTRMIHVGEQSGRLEEILQYLSAFYEEEFDDIAKNLTVILEPVLLIFIGIVVGFLGIAVITPIYQITSAIG